MTKNLAFDAYDFPWYFYGHRLKALHNTAYITDDGRLSYQLTVWCSNCMEEKAARGKLPPEYSSVERIQTVKIIVLGHFTNLCPSK
jgi:hypothetical protein